MTTCPDPTTNPDDCEVCHGWGHRCSAWIKAHPQQAARVQQGYEAGYDPATCYASVEACRTGEAITGAVRRLSTVRTVRTGT